MENKGARRARRVKIKVTKTDIRKGKRNSMMGCPVALAMRRGLDNTVWVSDDEADVIGWFDVILPAKVREFIRRFDSRHEVKPLTFMVTKP